MVWIFFEYVENELFEITIELGSDCFKNKLDII